MAEPRSPYIPHAGSMYDDNALVLILEHLDEWCDQEDDDCDLLIEF